LCIISWLAWFLVACVASKKFIKFLRKSLKEFGLNLKKKKSCFEKEFEKEKKEKTYLPTFRPSQACRPTKPPRSGPPNRLLFLFFSTDADTWAPPVSLTFPLPFFFPASWPAVPAPPRESRHAPPLPFPPSSPNRPIKAINPSLDQLESLLSFSTKP
jgi:hypothetical protein